MFSLTEILTIIFSSFGFMISVTVLLSGQQFTKHETPRNQVQVHRILGYLLLGIYIVIAFLSISNDPAAWKIILWLLGLFFYYIKIRFVRSKRGYRKYSSRLGIILFSIWIAILFINVILFNV